MILKKMSAYELQLQEQLQFAYLARINCVRELCDMLSHELSQPLTAISCYTSGYIRRLEADVYDKHQIIAALKTINQQVERTAKLVHRTKYFSHNFPLQYKKTNIHHLIRSTVALLAYEFPDFSITTNYKFTEHLPLVVMDDKHIKLVIFHILKNSIDELLTAKIKNPMLVIETFQINTQQISVKIKDNGRGISAAILEQIFRPCFTTKIKNPGMGLATCRSIIEAHNGEITASSLSDGGGTCFELTLPIYRKY